MAFVDKIIKGASSYDIQDARLKNLTATATQLNKTASTTLAGYEISDANITNGVITLGSNNITPLTADSTLDATKLSGTIDATKLSGTATITVVGNVTGNLTGNADTATSATSATSATTATQVSHALTIGTSGKNFNGSADVTLTASDLGLGQSMKFLGISTTAITDGGNENPTISGTEITTKNDGDVVIYGAQEFVYSSSAWHKLGDTADYILKTQAPGYADILTNTTAASTYLTQSAASTTYLGKTATASNSSQLEGHAASYFATATACSSAASAASTAQTTANNAATEAAKKGYPTASSFSSAVWNKEYRLGTLSSWTTLTLPTPVTTITQEIRITFCASGAFTPAFTMPSGYTALGTSDLSATTSGNYYEISCACIDASHIAIVMKEWS